MAIGPPRFRRYRYYLFTFAHVLASTRTFSNACEVLKADERMLVPVNNTFCYDMIAIQLQPSLSSAQDDKSSRSGRLSP